MEQLRVGVLTPQHLPARFALDFPYALAVLSRQDDGQVFAWIAAFAAADLYRSFKWMSVTKFLVALAFWLQSLHPDATQRLSLATPVLSPVQEPVELRDLLSHSSGLPFDGPVWPAGLSSSDELPLGVRFGIAGTNQQIIPPFTKRIYSNYNFEVATALMHDYLRCHWTEWVKQRVLMPLGMVDTKLAGSPAWGASGPILDLARLAAQMLHPSLLSHCELAEFTAPQHPGLRGVLPGYGHQRDNLWATGVELHGSKSPHYLPADFPPEVFGHFGQSGSFIWVDFAAGAAGVFLGSEPFGTKHRSIWPSLNAQMRQLALLAR